MLQNTQGKKLQTIKVSNIYKFSIYQVLTFMYKIKRDTALAAFRDNFREISHRYPTGFSQSNFVESNILSNQTEFAVSSRGPRPWTRLLIKNRKTRHKLRTIRTIILYKNCVLFDSHCDGIPCGFLW